MNREMKLWGGLLQECKDDIKNGKNLNCFVSSYLQQRSEAGYADLPGEGVTKDGWMTDLLLTYMAASPIEAGSDTTSNAMITCILMMLNHPHVLRRAREEIDAVVGDDRIPDFEDEEKLPYFTACVKESLRRRPPVIMGKF
jgi:cytochrome P450